MQDLFSDFKSATAADWKNQLIRDLKGEAYESLVWHNENGFEIKPFYTSEDLLHTYEPAFIHAHWEVTVNGKTDNSVELNKQLLRDLNAGASAISMRVGNHSPDLALKDIGLNYIQSSFYVNEENSRGLKAYLEKSHDMNEIRCSLFPEKSDTQKDLESWSRVVSLFKGFRNVKTMSVDVFPYHNQNCLAYYEVAIILSALAEYLEFFSAGKEIPKGDVVIKTGVNSDYFIQIAKLRAIRRLWTILKNEYKLTNGIHLIVETGLTNKSISDNYNNLLRTTIEAMAAVSGGCNELIVTEFDVFFPVNPTLSERMAVNQQLILREESYFDKMADTACGSFYIESITDAIAVKALETFKRFEDEGGYFKCIEKNIFSKDCEAQARQREELVKNQKQLAIGVNKFKNEKEKIDLPAQRIAELRHMPIHNPVLNFELENYFNLKNA